MPRSLVALGANLGDRAATIAQAIEMLRGLEGVTSLVASGLHETRPIGGEPGQEPFLNAAVALKTTVSPQQLHAALAQIEGRLGRIRGERWGARAIDLDLLLYDDLTLDTPELTVPHPRMAMRRFVLEPAAEVGADMMHPRLKWTVARLLAHLNTALPYLALLGLPGSGKTALAERLAQAFDGRVIYDPASELPGIRGGGSPAGAGGPGYAREIELLERRTRLLARDNWPSDAVLAAGDFYFDQSLAYALSALAPTEIAAFRLRFAEFRKQVILPKLLVVLDTSRSAAGPGTPATSEQTQLRQAMALVAARSGEGPVLYVGGMDIEAQFQEVAAAVQAMQ